MAIEAGSSTYYQAKRGIVQDGLVLHLDAGVKESYGRTGNTWYDLSGNDNHATIVNGAVSAVENGGILNFDGSDDYASVSSLSYGSNDPWTVVVMFNPKNSTKTYWNALFGGGLGVGGYFMFHGGISQLTYYEGNLDGAERIKYTGYRLGIHFPSNKYNFFVMRYNGDRSHTFFIRNQTYTYDGVSLGYTLYGSISLTLSRISAGDAFRYGDFKLGYFLLYDKALSVDEISQNYNATRHRFGL